MKTTTLSLAAGILLAPSFLQVLPFGEDLGWASCSAQGTWPWAGASQGTDQDDCWNTTTDASGNIYITGFFVSPTITFGSITLTRTPGTLEDFYIAKYDASGNALWAKNPNGGSFYLANGFSVATDASGNVYVAGSFYNGALIFGTTTLPYGGGLRDIFIVKYDAAGNVLWAKGAGGTGEDMGWGVATDPSGNVYITGSFESSSITFGTTTLANPGGGTGGAYFLFKFNAAGNVLWATSAAGSGTSWETPTDVITDASGNVYVCGSFRSPTITFGATTLTNNGFNNPFIVKYDAAGNVLWAKQGVSTWKCPGTALAINPSGTAVYMVGTHHMSSVSFGSLTLPQWGFWDGYMVKYDASSGAELCAQNMGELGNPNSDLQVFGAAVDASGSVYVTGSAYVNSSLTIGSTTFPIPNGQSPFFMGVFDPNCNLICKEALSDGAGGLNRRTAVTADASGNVYVASTFDNTFTVGTTVLTQTPNWEDVWLAKYVKCTSSSLNVTASSTNILCNGQCTGTGAATPSGGTSPYTYSWNTTPFQNTQTATGLCAGSYVCTVTDALGSTAAAPVTITQPTAITAAATSTPASCGSNNGIATVTAGGGTPNYTYSWSNGGTTSQISNLTSQIYSVTITDANGCTQTATVAVTQTGGPTITTSSTPQTCTQGGTATANASGGNVPYTYQWCNGQTTSTATNLSAGSCTVIVTDASGCSTTSTVTITTSGNIPTATVTSTSASCGTNNGTATATVSGGTSPYTYSWSSGQTTSAITGLTGGNYTVTITDAGGCTAVQTINVPQSSALTAAATATAASCGTNNGTATAIAGGGTSPYSYLWSNGQTTSTATGLSAGTYTITITDANGCTKTATAIVTSTGGPTATAASNVTITQGQSATLTAGGGGTYSWSNGSTQNPITVSPPVTTIYCVTVTAPNNCSDTACVTVTVNIEPIPCENIFIPNAFSPNGDGENDFFLVRGNCITQMKLVIYDRWGEKVFETTSQNPGWDGSYKGKIEDTAVFAFVLEATLASGEKINKKGNVSLLR